MSTPSSHLPTSTAEAVLKPSSKSYCSGRTRVQGYNYEDATTGEPKLDYEKLFSSFLGTGFQATNLADATQIADEMLISRQQPFKPDTKIEDEFIQPSTSCTIFLAYTSNMISSGIREHIRFLVKNKLVDCICTTAGGIEEDLIKCLEFNGQRADTFVGDFQSAGSELRENGINRIGNLQAPNDNYCCFEEWIIDKLNTMLKEQKASHGQLVWSPSKMIERLGLEIDHLDSVCYWAAKNKIPIFCPALTDGSLGDMLHLHAYRSPDLIIDIVSDIDRLYTFAHNTKNSKTGAIILGGGIVQRHTMNANLVRNGANYAVYINTAAEYDNIDSSAGPGELRLDGEATKVTCDASIALPLLVAQSFFKYASTVEKSKIPSRKCVSPPSTVETVLKPNPKSYCSEHSRGRGYTFEDTATKKPKLEHEQLISSFHSTGSQATNLAKAFKIVDEMLVSRKQHFRPDTGIEDEFIRPRANCTIFLSVSSSVMSSGVREHIRFLVKNKLIDCICTTAGGIEEDLIKCLELQEPADNGQREDTVERSSRLAGSSHFRSWLLPILDEMLNEQKASQSVWSPSKMIERLGLEINHTDSICFWAAKNKIPMFCPAITDGSIGYMLWSHAFKSRGLIIDINSDIHRLNSFAQYTERFKTGAIILGGGVPKHHTMNANLMRNGADYTVYINTAAEYDGSDSGANPDEAVSWVAQSFFKYAAAGDCGEKDKE